MHDTALYYGSLFFKTYVNSEKSTKILDLGSQDVNGSLRTFASKTAEYIGVDVVDGKGVDVKVTDPYKLPFEDNFFDAAVSSSCFEHTEFFWLSFLELLRVLKPEGLLYINAPSNGAFHRYPVDCWRFYPDSGIALVNWAHRNGLKETALLESFVGDQKNDKWNDFVAVFIKSKKHISAYKKRMTSSFSFGFSNAYLIGSEEVLNFKDQSFDQLLINKQKEEIHNLSSSLAQRTKETEQQAKTINTLNQTLTNKNNEIEKIINSRSFIITKPLRFLGRVLRGEFSLAFDFLLKIKFVTFILKKIPYKFSFKLKSCIYLKNIYKWSVEKKYFNYHFYNNKYVLNLDSWSAFKFYIEEGFLLNHNPSEKFSTILFYSFNPDLQAQKINPLLYYFFNQLECENFIEKCANLIIDENGYETPEYEPNLILNSAISHKNVPKIFAFFLPGFHEDEFNNEFWGKGFTEWNNLKKNNKPLFLGHKYPLEPYTYYNLNDEKIIREQCKLAKKSGIDGFYIFLYFFPGNKFPLYKIVPKLVEILTEEGLEFCFLWANESWSRRWDGLDKDILIEQNKGLTAKEISTYVSRISHFFKQKNYLTIDNKKYFAIYRPDYFKNSNPVIKQIKDEFKKEKIDVHLSACKSFSISQEILDEGEYDSIIEYPPHQLNDNEKNFFFQKTNNNLTTLHCYKNLFLHYVNYVNYFKYKKRIFRTIIPSWDNTPRKGKKSNLFINYSSANFNKFLSVAISDEMKNNEKDKVIFINSWNEWGEGANIEPDKTYGYWKLNCISRIKNNFITSELYDSKSTNIFNNDNIRLALVHIFYSNDFQYLLKLVKRYNNINFFVTVPKFKFNFETPNLKNLIIKTVHNEERDFNVVYQSKFIKNLGKYKIISKIHFKRRDQTVNKKINLYETYKIVEDQLKINSTLNELESNKFISKSNWSFKDQKIHSGSNEYFLKKLCDDYKCDYSEFLKSKFISGGIWTILDNSLAYSDFVNNIDYSNFYLDSEYEPYDGSYCHALERFICFYVQKKKFQIMLV